MLYGKKKDHKQHLPFLPQEDEPKPPPSPYPYNPLAEQCVPAGADDRALKSYAIYYRDRELASMKGDPMIAVIQAYSQAEAELEASRMQRQGCEILTIQSNEIVDFPTQRESEFAFPRQRDEGRSDDQTSYGADLLRRKNRQRLGGL